MAVSLSTAVITCSPVSLVQTRAARVQCSAISFANLSSPTVRNRNIMLCEFHGSLDYQWQTMASRKWVRISRVIVNAVDWGETALAVSKWRPPIQVATGRIPDGIDLKLFENNFVPASRLWRAAGSSASLTLSVRCFPVGFRSHSERESSPPCSTEDSDEIYGSVLKLVKVPPLEARVSYTSIEDEGSDDEDGLEFLIPLFEDIVKRADMALRCLFTMPPEGLLELARIPEILKTLKPQLWEFCQHQNAGIRSCLDSVKVQRSSRFSDDAKQLVAWGRHIEPYNRDVFMPTRRQLLSAGRHDLVEEIMAAGGFLSVAQALRLRSRRRPVGFWEDLRNLDAEIEWFVSGCWVVQQSPETGEELYYNRATDEYSRQKPAAGNVSNPMPVSQEEDDIGTAVMPRQQQVIDAGRYDLHHAILLHGGYKLVAQQLGRQPVSRDTTAKLVANMRMFMEENSLSRFPSFDELRAFERNDLVYSLRKHGGINSIAQLMDLRPKRYGKGQWHSLDFAAAAIRSYMCIKLILKRDLSQLSMDYCDLEELVWNEAVKAGILDIPTQAHVLKDGRSDLRYLLQKYGRKHLAEFLGVNYVDRRKRGGRGPLTEHLRTY